MEACRIDREPDRAAGNRLAARIDPGGEDRPCRREEHRVVVFARVAQLLGVHARRVDGEEHVRVGAEILEHGDLRVELRQLQAESREVYVDPVVQRYAVSLATATRSLGDYEHGDLAPYVAFGASPRGPIALVHSARALALIRGRAYVLPQDVQEMAKDALRHRLVLTYAALSEGVTADHVLDAVLSSVPVPQIDLARIEVA